jgi:hypothetical protein
LETTVQGLNGVDPVIRVLPGAEVCGDSPEGRSRLAQTAAQRLAEVALEQVGYFQ